MATLSTLITKTRTRLGTSVTTRFTDGKITDALNDVRSNLLLTDDITNFIKETTIAFTSGVGTLPTDYLRRLNKLNRNAKTKDLFDDNNVYKKVSITRFDDEVDLTWKESNGIINIYSADTVTLNFRYIYSPSDMSAQDDDSILPAQLDEWHSLAAAYTLYFNDQQYDISAQIKIQSNVALQNHFKKQRQDRGSEIISSFEEALLGEDLII